MNYIVMRRGYEYNDEINEPQEGGDPEKVFTDQDEAKKYCLDKNIKEISNCWDNIYYYCYELRELFTDPEEINSIFDNYDDDYEALSGKKFKSLSRLEQEKVISLMKMAPYYVVELK